jgi:serine/threonine-protein kinase RsbW
MKGSSMNDVETIKRTIPSEWGAEREAVCVVSRVASSIGLPRKRVRGLKFAVGEACINAFEHGYHNEPGHEVIVTITISDSKLAVEVRDFGRGCVCLDTMPKHGSLPRGNGLRKIQENFDDVVVESVPGEGTRIRMTIYRNGEQ